MNYSFLDQKLNTKAIYEDVGDDEQWRPQPVTFCSEINWNEITFLIDLLI